ncbi:MAG: hypothetical protein ABI887_16280 [Burkholderiales bacterium]
MKFGLPSERTVQARGESASSDWESALPSEMTTEQLQRLACDLRQIEVPDADESRLARPILRLQDIMDGRAAALGLTIETLDADGFDRIGGMYQWLVEREVVSRVTGVIVRSAERVFFRRLDAELRAMAAGNVAHGTTTPRLQPP